MNAPERNLKKPMTLIVALVGSPGSGRRDVARILKQRHGFAVTAFEQPVRDAVVPLYGATAIDLLFDPTAKLPRWDKSPQELTDALRAHAESIGGPEFLTRRLVDRTVARGEWHNQDLVITDLKSEAELLWLRMVGGTPIWMRRPWTPEEGPDGDPIMKLALTNWRVGDAAIMNDASEPALEFKVASIVERLHRDAEELAEA
jgi:hypothetical protein